MMSYWGRTGATVKCGVSASAVALGFLLIGGASRTAAAQENAGACWLFCTPSVAIEPTLTIEPLIRRHRVQDVESGDIERAQRGAEFEMVLAVWTFPPRSPASV